MKKIAFLPFLLLMLFSCQNGIRESTEISEQDTSSYLDPNYEYVQLIPDSLRTDEQNALLIKIQSVINEHLKAVDNKLVFTLSKEEFVAKGIPEEYYTLIQKDLVNNNKFVKENNINVDSLLGGMQKD